MVTSTTRVRIPPLTDISVAIRKFYERAELSNSDIQDIFGKHSSATICKMKRLARQKMIEQNVPVWNDRCVNTKSAYESWGIDISDLERRYAKLKQLAS